MQHHLPSIVIGHLELSLLVLRRGEHVMIEHIEHGTNLDHAAELRLARRLEQSLLPVGELSGAEGEEGALGGMTAGEEVLACPDFIISPTDIGEGLAFRSPGDETEYGTAIDDRE